LFHVKPTEIWSRCAEWAGHDLDATAVERLQQYRSWLIDEAIPSGGLGPDEGPRVDQRHIGDSLLFASVFDHGAEEVWDVGSGVGLPGIPLAILLAGTEFVLLDRSARRVNLARRAVRILRLENVQVLQGEIDSIPAGLAIIVSRATLPPGEAAKHLAPRIRPGGQLVLGGSWDHEPVHPGWETIPVPGEILDHQVWILMMRHS
jgi:16S rRNA (guanine527-N7)-methyltransferase